MRNEQVIVMWVNVTRSVARSLGRSMCRKLYINLFIYLFFSSIVYGVGPTVQAWLMYLECVAVLLVASIT